MAKKSLIAKQLHREKRRLDALQEGKKMNNISKHYNRCKLCGRQHGYIRDFGICRVCFRTYARQWLILGIRKAAR